MEDLEILAEMKRINNLTEIPDKDLEIITESYFQGESILENDWGRTAFYRSDISFFNKISIKVSSSAPEDRKVMLREEIIQRSRDSGWSTMREYRSWKLGELPKFKIYYKSSKLVGRDALIALLKTCHDKLSESLKVAKLPAIDFEKIEYNEDDSLTFQVNSLSTMHFKMINNGKLRFADRGYDKEFGFSEEVIFRYLIDDLTEWMSRILNSTSEEEYLTRVNRKSSLSFSGPL